MILCIEELGVIKQAQFDLSKKLLLFCGKNSTGKTYAAYVLQAFLSAENSVLPLKCYQQMAEQMRASGTITINKENIEEWLEAKCEKVRAQMGSIFGISDTTCEKLFRKFKIKALYSDADYAVGMSAQIKGGLKEGELQWNIFKSPNSNVIRIESNVGNQWVTANSLRFSALASGVIRQMAFGDKANVRMLTVERNSIYTFKTELSLSRNELIDRIQQQSDHSEIDVIDLINKSSRRYPQAVRSSLRIANDLENVQKYESPFSEVADMMEHDLLNGEVSMTKNGDVEFHAVNMAKTQRLPFHLSSSIVKTMASLVIYLRHIARKGDTLIIDEPEMNFHPDVQIVLARLFAMLTAKGLQVIISTHSDYIVREFNNLIMAGELQRKGEIGLLQELGITEDMTLDYHNLTVMQFVKTSKTILKALSLPVDQWGFAVSTIDNTVERQNQCSETLYDALAYND